MWGAKLTINIFVTTKFDIDAGLFLLVVLRGYLWTANVHATIGDSAYLYNKTTSWIIASGILTRVGLLKVVANVAIRNNGVCCSFEKCLYACQCSDVQVLSGKNFVFRSDKKYLGLANFMVLCECVGNFGMNSRAKVVWKRKNQKYMN